MCQGSDIELLPNILYSAVCNLLFFFFFSCFHIPLSSLEILRDFQKDTTCFICVLRFAIDVDMLLTCESMM